MAGGATTFITDDYIRLIGSANTALNLTGSAGTVPVYKTGIMNGLPVIRFANDGSKYLTFTTRLATIRTVFWVVSRNPSGLQYTFLFGDTISYIYDFCGASNMNSYIFSNAYTSTYVKSGLIKLNGTSCQPIEATGSAIPMPTTPSVFSVRTTSNVAASTLSKDRTQLTRSWTGDIAEVIIYNRALTNYEISRVENYLATKYNISVNVAQ